MATLEVRFLQEQLEERKRRLEVAIASAPPNSGLLRPLKSGGMPGASSSLVQLLGSSCLVQ